MHKNCDAVNKEKGCGDPRSPKKRDSEVVKQKTLENWNTLYYLL